MQLVFRLALGNDSLEPADAEPGTNVRVLIMYEKVGDCNDAVVRLNSIAQDMLQSGRIFCALWNAEFLEDPSLLMIASREAVSADLVLVTAGFREELSPLVVAWLRDWLPKRACRPSALGVVVGDETFSKPIGCGRDSLEDVLRKAGIFYFATGGGTRAGGALALAMHRALTTQAKEPPLRAAAPVSASTALGHRPGATRSA